MKDKLLVLHRLHEHLRVPKDDLALEIDEEFLDSDVESMGNLPYLIIDLTTVNIDKNDSRLDYPKLTLYEDDLVLDRVRQYIKVCPLPAQTEINLIEHIVYKLEQLQ